MKLSALHPRYQPSQEARLQAELLPRLSDLALAMREAWLPLTIDAEEADKLDLSLALMEPLFTDPALVGLERAWACGAGLQQARAAADRLACAAWPKRPGRRIPVRLVKGAYWDSEIKWAQEAGLAGYPVFTRKVNTDVAYLAAARALLARPDCFYPQFATHNAHTIAAIAVLAGDRALRVPAALRHGRGAASRGGAARERSASHAASMRRSAGTGICSPISCAGCLENGANTSFVNRLADDEAPIAAIVADPVEKAARARPKGQSADPAPAGSVPAGAAEQSRAAAVRGRTVREPLLASMRARAGRRRRTANPIVSGEEVEEGGEVAWITSPHDRQGRGRRLPERRAAEAIDRALAAAKSARDAIGTGWAARRAPPCSTAPPICSRPTAPALMALMVREAGKTLANAQGDLREAVDHLRYAAAEARAKFAAPRVLKGPTGERERAQSCMGAACSPAISPWNFPLAIFTGQIAGALAAGNAVVAKPAEQTPLVAARAVRLLHQAGVPPDVLHLLPGDGETVGAALVSDPRVDGVAFTGGTDTGIAINRALAARDGPIVKLIAETGGLNAMIVDSSALPEQVVDDALASAFDSAGQRCSALRVLFLQEDVAGEMLAHAARRGARAQDRRSARLRDRCRAGDRRGGAGCARSPQGAHARGGARAARSAAERRACARHLCRAGHLRDPVDRAAEARGVRPDPACGAVRRRPAWARSARPSTPPATGSRSACTAASRPRPTSWPSGSRSAICMSTGTRSAPWSACSRSAARACRAPGPRPAVRNYLEAFAVERVRSTDLTASGGNASLLAAGSDERMRPRSGIVRRGLEGPSIASVTLPRSCQDMAEHEGSGEDRQAARSPTERSSRRRGRRLPQARCERLRPARLGPRPADLRHGRDHEPAALLGPGARASGRHVQRRQGGRRARRAARLFPRLQRVPGVANGSATPTRWRG